VIDWEVRTGSNVSDCRSVFDGLVALTKRKPGCCTVRITADQVTSTAPLQSFINSAAAQAEKVTVCLSGGTYSLPMPLRLDARHAGMTFESCGGSAALRADPAALKTLFIDGLLVLTGVQGVTLRGLTLSPPLVDAPASATTNGSRTGVGVRALDAQNLTLEQCTIVFVPDSDTKADLFGACISLQGNCSGLAVQHCQLSSTIAPTFTPRAIGATGAVPAAPTTVVARAVAAPPTAPGPSTSIDVDLSHVFPPLPASSPPRRIEALLADRASAALAVLTKDRQVSPPPAGTGRFIVTVGVLAVGYVDATSPSTTLACALGAATLRDTTFTGLTFATWLSAAATSLRLQDNRVTQGIAGLWLEQPGAGYFTPITNTDGQYLPIVDFDEFLLLLLVSTIATPPTPSFPVTAAAGSNIPPAAVAEKVTTQTNFTLFLSGNQVELGSAARGNSAAKNSSAALFCALYTGAEVEDPPELAVLISANHLRSVSEFATALLTLPADQPCAITGNVIVNQGPRILERELGEIVFRPGEAPPSLWVVLPQSADSTALSVIGNVLQGPSDLSLIPRVVASTRVGLSPYNADPN
jgi:hypothetical protein